MKYVTYMCFLQLVHTSNGCWNDYHDGKKLEGFVLTVVNGHSLYSCASECVSVTLCESMNYDKKNKVCHMNYRNSTPNTPVNDINFVHSDRESLSKIRLSPCHTERCGLFERCMVNRLNQVSCDPYLHNVAVHKPATSSTSYGDGNEVFGPDRAVDGNLATHWSTDSCFAVLNGDRDPWWQVDLGNQFLVFEIRVSARGDCCPERLRDFELRVYDENPSVVSSPPSRLCNKYVGKVTVPGAIVTLTCVLPVTGRYVKVIGDTPKGYEDILQFCEVQVFGVQFRTNDTRRK